MIVVMKTEAGTEAIAAVIQRLTELGLEGRLDRGVERTIIGVVGRTYPELKEMLSIIDGVDDVVPVSKPYKLASREFCPLDSVIDVAGVRIGGPAVVVMAGPCAVESEEQLLATAHAVKAAGATILRAGAFKPSTSPYNFRGLGLEGLQLLAEARRQTGLPVITEVLTPGDVETVAQYADILQIGTRNMQNFILLEEAGRTNKPVMLKRGMSATVQEWLLSAEYILARGNQQVMLCERGIRTFETYTRNTMDVSAIPAIERLSHLPIIADPSHGTGRWHLVGPLALASIAAGADGLIIEVHPSPDHALKDGSQSLSFENFELLMPQARSVAGAIGRGMATPAGRVA